VRPSSGVIVYAKLRQWCSVSTEKQFFFFEVLCGGVCTILPVYDLGSTCVLASGRWGVGVQIKLLL
jgi:hypothetical protein